ncbi:DNA-binding transcriptional regulator, MocR family, contains an aminotransferase domain [Actinopolymorpha cephalotaxi]|uniref:DNA-binding transcriptional regulator, MocR family, contains an aminotransferase domain n=1 Tax=Actinopolymorpha cephalotaxi TaxID=504797 RepID=A0A1I2PG66_9ACTN|nr:DNA-binding transcriptional regulator, MocR family, contains an aminotransferase domain [Actinopolymorpha cephalotaxi]
MSLDHLVRQLGVPASRMPAYVWLADRLNLLVAEGRLTPGATLPAERAMATALGLSRTTVVRGLALAEAQGIVAARRGAGRTVRSPRRRSSAFEPLEPGLGGPEGDQLDLRSSQMPPVDGIGEAMRHATESTLARLTPGGYHTAGIPELREAICAHYASRGLPTTPDQVLVTTGAVNGVHLAVRALAGPGRRVVVENPCYPNTVRTIAFAGSRSSPVDTEDDDAGHAMAHALTNSDAPCALLIPEFQNPTGRLMGEQARSRVLRAARRRGVALVVDETLVATNWRELEMPSPLTARGVTTVLVGSMSKSHWAGLRIGWVRAPRRVVDLISHQRLGADLGAPLHAQVLAADLLARPLPHQRWKRVADNHDLLLRELRTRLRTWRIDPVDGGLNLWCRLPAPKSEQLVRAAGSRGLLLATGHVFSPGGHGWGARLRLPFTAHSDDLVRAAGILAEVAGEHL